MTGFIILLFMGLTALLLIKDLDRPERFLYVLLRPNFDSWLVKGGYIIGAFSTVVFAQVLLDLSNLHSDLQYFLFLVGVPLAWMTGSYTGWLLRQAKARSHWANRSSMQIAFTGTFEMMVLGFLVPAFALYQAGVPDPDFTSGVSLTIHSLVWFSFMILMFTTIRRDLRKAQVDPLL